MKIIDTTGKNVSEITVEVNKGIGALTFKTSKIFEDMKTEKINIQIQRANGDNIEITNGNIPLTEFLLLGTIGDDAIGYGINPEDEKAPYQVKATIELVEVEMSAIHLYDKDLIRVALTGLTKTATYIFNGHEAPLTTDAVNTYERKSMNSEHENMDFVVGDFDACVITDNKSIDEINLRFDNGAVIKTNPQELRDLQESVDPIAQVKFDGTVISSFPNYLQLPLKGIININIRKTQGDIVSLLFRHDADLKNF